MLLILLLASLPPITRDLSGGDPGSWEDWMLGEPPAAPLVVDPLFVTPCDGRGTQFAILLETGLSDSLTAGTLEQWASDMAPWVGDVLVAEITYSTPEDLRSWLSGMYAEGLDGVVLVGDLPVAWVQLDNAFLRDSETFPCDLFLMDLDGTWGDEWVGYPSQGNPGSDGRYDTWSGDLDPEIYCARIKTSNLTIGTEAGLIQAYLDRNHTWRTWGDPGSHQALCYVDDDWSSWGVQYANAMRKLYPDVELVNQVDSTCGTDYEEDRLTGDYVWISPYVHSSPLLHQWSPGPETMWNEVYAINPGTRFYNLFACSNCRFTTPRNMGSVYTFATDHGLAAVGSTKSGSMLEFDKFYTPLGQSETLGEAYFQWWTFITTAGGFTPYEMSWHMGMVLIGDPTLRPCAELYGIPGQEEGAGGPAGILGLVSNPARGVLEVDLLSPCVLEVRDAAGRLVASREVSGAGRLEVDMSGLPPGCYSCTASSGPAVVSGRFVLLR